MKTKKEIEQLADKWYTEKHQMIPSIIEQKSFINGYTQCQEDMGDKRYTEEDMIKFAIHYRNNVSGGSLIRNMLSDFTLNKQD